MPHLTYSADKLDTRYPPLVAPEDEGLVDATDDGRGGVYQYALGLASEIRAQVAAQGRRRRPADNSLSALLTVKARSSVRIPAVEARSSVGTGALSTPPAVKARSPVGRSARSIPTAVPVVTSSSVTISD